MRLLRLTLVLAGLASTPAFAGGKEDLGKKLLETSGLKAQVEQIPQLLEGSIEQYQGKMPPELFDAFARAMRQRFAMESFYPPLEAGFLKAVNEKALKDVDDWYQSPFATKLTELEKEASRPEAQAELQQFAQSMQATPPPAARMKLIQGMDRALRSTDLMVDLTVGVAKGMARGMSAATGKPSDGLTAKQLKAMRAQLLPTFRNLTQVSFLYTYQSLSDQELKDYLKYLSTPSAKAFNGAISKGFEAAFEDAAVKIGKDLAETMGPKKGR